MCFLDFAGALSTDGFPVFTGAETGVLGPRGTFALTTTPAFLFHPA